MTNYLILDYTVREKIWGSDYFLNHKMTDKKSPAGELWSCSGHKESLSYITKGEFKGQSLDYLYKNNRELFGTKEEDFPLLIKLISASQNLSVQVHPDNLYAREKENEFGKTEGWLILGEKSSNIILGHNAKNRNDLEKYINNNDFTNLLRKFDVNKGEFYKVYPGTIHAICGSNLILEIQQSSNVTYRFYDYDRVTNGKKRELHLKKALEVTRFEESLIDKKNYFLEKEESVVLWDNDYFSVELVNVFDEYEIKALDKFLIVTVLDDFLLENNLLTFASSFIVTKNSSVNIKGSGRIVISRPK